MFFIYTLGVYEEDVIVTKDKKKIGIVLKAHRDDESDESEDSFDEDEDEKIEEGKVMIGWYSSNPRWNDEDTSVVDENTVCCFAYLLTWLITNDNYVFKYIKANRMWRILWLCIFCQTSVLI